MRTFPYREVGYPPKARPVLDVEISFGPNAWRTQALVDTGSPITVFDWGTADALVVRLGNAGARTGRVALMGKQLQVQFENMASRIRNLSPTDT